MVLSALALTVNESVCVLFKGKSTEDTPVEFVNVIVDTKHKVTDHFIVQEKLGV